MCHVRCGAQIIYLQCWSGQRWDLTFSQGPRDIYLDICHVGNCTIDVMGLIDNSLMNIDWTFILEIDTDIVIYTK